MAHEVFVGCGVSDQAVADAVCARLESVHQIECRAAPRDVPPGVPLAQARLDALDRSKIMVLVGSGDIASTQMEREVERAVQRGITVVPLRWTSATPAGAPATGTALSTPVDLEVSRVSTRVAALVGGSIGNAAPGPGRGRSSWEIPALVGLGIIVIGLLAGLGLRASLQPVDQAVSAPVPMTMTSTQPAQAALQPMDGARAPTVSEAATAARVSPQDSSAETSASTADSDPASLRAIIGGATTTATARGADRPAIHPSDWPPAPEPAAASVPARAAQVENAAPRRPAPDAVVLGPDVLGTLAIDFANTYPDGTVEIAIDGHKEWTETLSLGQQGSVFSRMLLQRTSSQVGSSLKTSVGDHKVTVTMLNAAGEVRYVGTTVIHIDPAHPATLRIRVTRFRNRLMLESVN